MLSLILLFLSASLTIIWTLPLVLLKIFKVHLFKIDSREKVALLLRKIKPYSSIIKDDEQASGFIFGWTFIGYIHDYKNQRGSKVVEIWLFTNRKKYKKIMENNDIKNDKNFEKMIEIYERKGCYWHFEFSKRKINLNKYNADPSQEIIMEQIKEYYKENDKCVVYLQGIPGSGKSLLVLLTARDLKAGYCCSHNPTDPGDELSVLYNTVLPTKENPLIIVLEEFDIIIGHVHKESIIKHKSIPTPVKDKTSWNQYLDYIDLDMYPYLILILTSNKEKEYIDNLDSSYLREGRVNLYARLGCIV